MAASADVVPPPPPIKAASAFLVQAQSGAVLYEENAFEARPPASLTKMVTALVVMDHCAPDAVATVSANAAAAEGSEIGLAKGEQITVGELLKGLMLPSGNDAAVCLAEHVAGSEEAFAELMNAKAAELGAVNTHFVNASGLTAEGHPSCARDLAVFGLAVRLEPYLSEIIRQPSATVRWCDGRSKAITNLNRLLARCRGCDGVKTGFTTPAGRCLAASAQRDGYSLMCVVLKSPDSWSESGALLNWGFAQPPVAVIEVQGEPGAEPVRLPAPIIDGRLHVDCRELLNAAGVSWDDSVPRPESLVTWRGKPVVPAADLCAAVGLSLRFDKPTLTAFVARR